MRKKIILIPIFFILFGCSAIMHSIGESDINKGMEIYRQRGLTTDGINYLTSGLQNAPNSILGIDSLKLQYMELNNSLDKIYKKTQYTRDDINRLKLYLFTSERYMELGKKIPQLYFDSNLYFNNKMKIQNIFEKYVIDDKIEIKNRQEKIGRITYYRSLVEYIQSYKIQEKIKKMEQEVTVNLVLQSSLRNNFYNPNIQNTLLHVSERYKNKNIGNYIYLRGFSSYVNYFQNNVYIVEFEISNFDIVTLEMKEKDEIDGKKSFIEKKKLMLWGQYKVIDPKLNRIIEIKPIKIDEKYEIKVEKGNNKISFSDENEIINKIMEKQFGDIILYKLKNISIN